MGVTKMRESEIEKKFTHKCETELKAVCWKYTGVVGAPDRMVILPNGKVIFAEIKAPNGRVRPIQKKRHRQLQNQKVPVYVIFTVGQIDDFITEMRGLYGI